MKVDFVVTWVDGTDAVWQSKKQATSEIDNQMGNANSDSRFRDMDIFQYWFRTVEKYSPWVNRIYLITDNQVPKWLNVNHPKLRVIDHSDIIQSTNLPTFNSNSIELSIPEIQDLSEHFVLFNDDTFINRPMDKADFFDENGLPRDSKSYNMIVPTGDFQHIPFNNVALINRLFSKGDLFENLWNLFKTKNFRPIIKHLLSYPASGIAGFYDYHMPISYRKSNFLLLRNKFKKQWYSTIAHPFRTTADISHLLVRYYQLETRQYSFRNPKLNKLYSIEAADIIAKDIAQETHYLIDINDNDSLDDLEFNNYIRTVKTAYDSKLPDKSSFEL